VLDFGFCCPNGQLHRRTTRWNEPLEMESLDDLE